MKAKNLFLSIVCFCVLFSSGITAIGRGEEGQSPTIGDLNKRIAALEARIVNLEEQIQKLSFVLSNNSVGMNKLPSSWGKFDFNGMSYYIVPIEDKKLEPKKINR